MIALLQRVLEARVVVGDAAVGAIGPGLLVFLAVQPDDTESTSDRTLQRVLAYRVFADAQGRMNRSVVDTGGDVLLVPQFTLAADTSKGNRPSFTGAATPAHGRRLFEHCVARAENLLPGRIASGTFGADMQVQLTNDGPVTFWLEV